MQITPKQKNHYVFAILLQKCINFSDNKKILVNTETNTVKYLNTG